MNALDAATRILEQAASRRKRMAPIWPQSGGEPPSDNEVVACACIDLAEALKSISKGPYTLMGEPDTISACEDLIELIASAADAAIAKCELP